MRCNNLELYVNWRLKPLILNVERLIGGLFYQVHNRAKTLFGEVCKALPLIPKNESGAEQEDFGVDELNNYIQELEQIINMEKENFEVDFWIVVLFF